MNDEPQDERAILHARIGGIIFELRERVTDLIAIRLNPAGFPLIQGEEADLMTIKNSMDWLLSDIRESRPKVRIVHNG